MHKTHPVGEVVDYFFRVEFQQRGSPHVHMLLWVKNAPNVSSDSYEKISQFVDRYVSCSKSGADPVLVNYQTHRHAKTCMKKNKPICRFNFPIPPMPKTVTLSPLEDEAVLPEAKANYQKVCMLLNSDEIKNTDMDFKEFLSKLEIDRKSVV